MLFAPSTSAVRRKVCILRRLMRVCTKEVSMSGKTERGKRKMSKSVSAVKPKLGERRSCNAYVYAINAINATTVGTTSQTVYKTAL